VCGWLGSDRRRLPHHRFPIDYQQPWVAGSGLDESTDDPLNHPTTWFIDVYNGSGVASIDGRLWVLCVEIPDN
jgi:hypothetical protein